MLLVLFVVVLVFFFVFFFVLDDLVVVVIVLVVEIVVHVFVFFQLVDVVFRVLGVDFVLFIVLFAGGCDEKSAWERCATGRSCTARVRRGAEARGWGG